MNYYVVNGKSPKALAVYTCPRYDEAEAKARKEFGGSVIVIDEEMYRIEQRIAPQRAAQLARKLMRRKHLRKKS